MTIDGPLAMRVEGGNNNLHLGVMAEAIRVMLDKIRVDKEMPDVPAAITAADAQATASHSGDQHGHELTLAVPAVSPGADGASGVNAAAGPAAADAPAAAPPAAEPPAAASANKAQPTGGPVDEQQQEAEQPGAVEGGDTGAGAPTGEVMDDVHDYTESSGVASWDGSLENDDDIVDALDDRARKGHGLLDNGNKTLTGEKFLEQKALLEEQPSKWKAYRAKVKRLTRSGYIAVDGHGKSTGGVRRCLHDAVINAANRVGVAIDAKKLMQQCRAVATKDRTFHEVTSAEAVGLKVRFTNVNVNNLPGGNEAALLSIEDGGVYVVQMQVDGKTAEFHACVYDSRGTLPRHKPHSGMLIDNRKRAPIYLIEPKDRASTQAKRDMLNDFYNVQKPGRVYVMQVWRIEPVEGVEVTSVPTGINYHSAAEPGARGIVAYTRTPRDAGLADSPVKKMKKATLLEDMDVDELQEEYKTKLNVTQVRGSKARDRCWLIDKINGGLTVRALTRSRLC